MFPTTLHIIYPILLCICVSLKRICTRVYENLHLQEDTLYDLDIGFNVTQTAAQYLPRHVTYENVKFVVAMSNSLGGYTFTRKYII